MFADILNRGFYHNRIFDYLLCLAIFAGGVFLVNIVRALATRRLKKRAAAAPTHLDDFVLERVRRTAVPLAYLGIAEASLRVLTLTPRVERISDITCRSLPGKCVSSHSRKSSRSSSGRRSST